MARHKLPGLQVPSTANGEARGFYEALKERLELISGERGDPNARSVTAADLAASRAAARTAVTVAASATSSGTAASAQLDLALLPTIGVNNLTDATKLLVQDATVSSQRSLLITNLLNILARLDQSVTIVLPWTFTADPTVSNEQPRYRWLELPAGDGVEDALPADSAIWDLIVDSAVASFRVRDDEDETGASVFDVTRTGINVDSFDVQADALQHLGVQVVTAAANGIVKTDELVELDNAYVGEVAQDAVAAMFADSASLDVTYTDGTPALSAEVIPGGVDHNALANLTTGDPHTQYAKRLSSIVSPAQITADQNDYAPTGIATATVLRLNSDAARSITGLVCDDMAIINVGSFNITLKRQDAASAAANRFAIPTDIVIPPDGAVWLWRDVTTTRLRCLATSL